MQTVKGLETTSARVAETEPSGLAAADTEAKKQEPSKKVSGLHKVTPCTIKSLKTTYDQTSSHCSEFGSLLKAGRLARGSVNCLRIFREVTMILPRASVALGNDLAEHFFRMLEKIADRFDGKHEEAAVTHEGEPAKRKPKWLGIVCMLFVSMYCFNGLKSLLGGHINITPSSKIESKDDKDEKVEKAIATALAKKLQEAPDNDADDESDKPQDGVSNPQNLPPPPPNANLSKKALSEKVLKKSVKDFVKEVVDSQ